MPKDLKKLSDEEIAELVGGARLANAGDDAQGFVDSFMNLPEGEKIPAITPEQMEILLKGSK